jgi:hydrogenase maturation protein HypF
VIGQQVLPRAAPRRVLALGGYLKNRACLLQGRNVHWTELHGDLSTARSCEALHHAVHALLARADGPVHAIAHDRHPDFESTRLALRLAQDMGIPSVAVQHHHAHIGVVQAETGLGLSQSHTPDLDAGGVGEGQGIDATEGGLIGLALDGVGLGDDGSAWGGELLHVMGWRCERLAHLTPIALPGADVAAREPWRMAAAALHALGRSDEIVPRLSPVVGEWRARGVYNMLRRNFNCPPTTSAGRWFDAVSALLGLSAYQTVEAQAAVALEQSAAAWLAHSAAPVYEHAASPTPTLFKPLAIDMLPLVRRCLEHDATPAAAAALFHDGLAASLVQAAQHSAQIHDAWSVALGGGCFFNRVLSAQVTTRLQAAGLTVLQPSAQSGPGDAGLALGQAWVAALSPLAQPSTRRGQPQTEAFACA